MIKSLFNIAMSLLLALSMTLPTAWQPFKVVLLSFCIIFAISLVSSKNAKITNFMVITTFIFVTSGLAWATFGLIKGNPGAIPTTTVMVIYPLILPLLACCHEEADTKKLRSLFVSISLLIVFFDLLFIISSIAIDGNIFSTYVFDIYKDDAVIDDAEDYFKFTVPNISSCIFLLPFLITYSIYNQHLRKTSIICAILMLLIIILSARRAGFITPILAIFLAHLITMNGPKTLKSILKLTQPKKIIFIFFIFLLLLITSTIFLQLEGIEFYINEITSIANFTTNESNIERANQFKALLSGIAENPLFGAGAGAAANYSRSETQPWAYELSYVAFIFQYGIVGFIIYSLGILTLAGSLAIHSKLNGRNTFEFAYLAGLLSFLLANATNPYIGKFDYMWTIFIPLALINTQILNTKRLSNIQ